MDDVDRLALRSDIAAERYLASTLTEVYKGGPERFDDNQIAAFRESFKLGWMTGFKAALDDTAEELKGLVEDE